MLWTLHDDRPVIEITLPLPGGGSGLVRRLIADTGAGKRKSVFQLLLLHSDCLQCGGYFMGKVQLGGAYSGMFPVYLLQVQIASLNFDEPVEIVGIPHVPLGYDGIAAFRFLNRFHFGNFGNGDIFGLE